MERECCLRYVHAYVGYFVSTKSLNILLMFICTHVRSYKRANHNIYIHMHVCVCACTIYIGFRPGEAEFTL